MQLEKIQEQIKKYTFPPVEKWQPPLSGAMDLLITRQGDWIHEGSRIKRAALSKLLSSVLRFEDNQYFLISPVEKWQISVECLPLVIVAAEKYTASVGEVAQEGIILTDNHGNFTELNSNHALTMIDDFNRLDATKAQDQKIPVVSIRHNLQALVSRSVYYQLVEWAELTRLDNGKEVLQLNSFGSDFCLGELAS